MATKTKKSKKSSATSKIELARSRIVPIREDFDFLKILVYGRNGTGKTHMGATGPKPLIIDCNERGTLAARMFDAHVFRLETWTDIDLIYWYLAKGDHDHETVVVDTVTLLQGLCMKFVLGEEAAMDPTKDPNMPTKREWGKLGELMRSQVLRFRNLPMHVVFLAQERRGFTEDEEEEPEVFPEVSPSSRSTLTASVNIIGRSYVKEVVKKVDGKKKMTTDYRLLVGPSERYITKVNIQEHGLPGVIRDPNVTRIIERIKTGGK